MEERIVSLLTLYNFIIYFDIDKMWEALITPWWHRKMEGCQNRD